jgi:hypothetical protein
VQAIDPGVALTVKHHITLLEFDVQPLAPYYGEQQFCFSLHVIVQHKLYVSQAALAGMMATTCRSSHSLS